MTKAKTFSFLVSALLLEYLGSKGGCQSASYSRGVRDTADIGCERSGKNSKTDQWFAESIELGRICKNYSNRFFNAIMGVEHNDEYCPSKDWGLGQVDNTLLQEKKLHQKAERFFDEEELNQRARQFLECCLSFDSSDAQINELISEIVAVNDISRKKARTKLAALHKRAEKLKEISEKASTAKRELSLSITGISSINSIPEKEAFEAICRLRFSLKLWLKYDAKFHKGMRELVESFWVYFYPKAQTLTESYVYSLLKWRFTKGRFKGRMLTTVKELEVLLSNGFKNHRRGCRKKVESIDFSYLIDRHYGEVTQLINSVLQRLDQNRSKSDWYDPLLMESFLDSLVDKVGDDTSKLVPYTKEMDDELEILLDGVEVD